MEDQTISLVKVLIFLEIILFLEQQMQMVLRVRLTFFFVPIVLVIAVPLGLLYAFQRSQLLKKLSGQQVAAGDVEKVEFLRRSSLRFYVPAIVFAVWALFILVIVVMS